MKFFNPRDIAFIVLVTIVVHIVAKPLYRAIDGETSGAPSPDDNA
jgi:hypothetical protein